MFVRDKLSSLLVRSDNDKQFINVDASVTNAGLLLILRRMVFVHSLGEFGISDNFLRSLRVVSSLRDQSYKDFLNCNF
jgi:hypothetical protein